MFIVGIIDFNNTYPQQNSVKLVNNLLNSYLETHTRMM